MPKTRFSNENWINQQTGEIVETQTVVKHGDFDFHKLWLAHILDAMDEVGNVKIKVLMHLLRGMNGQNLYIGTISQISESTNAGYATVQRLLSSLEKCEVITRPARGQIRISPKVIFKGGHSKRMNVLIKYRDESQLDLFDHDSDKSEEAA